MNGEFIKKILFPKHDTSYAYRMGYDCEHFGANEKNCHFSIFSSKDNMQAWEQGKKAAQSKRKK